MYNTITAATILPVNINTGRKYNVSINLKLYLSQTVFDNERSNEIGNEGGASGLVFFGMQVELDFGAITR
jgi:hypothetical protein